MSTPSNGAEYDRRVVIEIKNADGVLRRVHLWVRGAETLVAFSQDMTEAEATAIVAAGKELLAPINVAELFKEPRARAKRHIEVD